jgi:hypothetical protein
VSSGETLRCCPTEPLLSQRAGMQPEQDERTSASRNHPPERHADHRYEFCGLKRFARVPSHAEDGRKRARKAPGEWRGNTLVQVRLWRLLVEHHCNAGKLCSRFCSVATNLRLYSYLLITPENSQSCSCLQRSSEVMAHPGQ